MSGLVDHSRSDRVQGPRTSRHGNRVQMRYDLPQRLTTSKVYPLRSHRGSEIIVSGHEDGLHIIWRGGNPLRERSRTIVARNNVVREWNEPVPIQEIDEHSGKPRVTASVHETDKPAFEEEDEELDDEEACFPIIQELRLSTGSSVLQVAVPHLPAQDATSRATTATFDQSVPVIMQANIVVAVACADSSVRIITLPLAPPSASAKRKHTLGAQICTLACAAPIGQAHRALSMSWTQTSPKEAEDVPHGLPESLEDQKYDLVVALSSSGITNTLTLFRVPLTFDPLVGGLLPDQVDAFQTIQLTAPVSRTAFNSATFPSAKHSQLLLTDTKGSLKVYDFLASDSAKSRPSSRHSARDSTTVSGAWMVSFDTPFHMPRDVLGTHAGLVRRKSILDACWVMSGRAVFVLLGDGEWGVWRIDGGASVPSTQSSSMTSFAFGGTFLGDRTESNPASETKPRSNPRLAPMTPNTRKVRQESLFSGPSSVSATNVPKGGISAVTTTTTHGTPDDSIVFWYGSQVYYIASLASISQGSNSRGRDLGSLYGPGLARLENINTCGEMLNDIAQFPARNTAASAVNFTHRDILITSEYRFVIVSATRPQTPGRSLFARESGSPTTTYDLQLLEKGELDLNGMSRLLDGMAGVEHTNGYGGKPKRVGFVR